METNTPISTINNRIFLGIFLLFALISNQANAQLCGNDLGCATTNYANFGFNSNNDPASIEYDNFQSAFHATVIRTGSGTFQVWGERTKWDAADHHLVPAEVNAANYPGLSGTPLKITIGGTGNQNSQIILLTTTGLFAWGSASAVFSTAIKSSIAFGAVNMAGFGGQANGLPIGVSPSQVKVLTASGGTLAILTCSGEVWMLTNVSDSAGDGTTTPNNTWHRVTTNQATNPFLSNIISMRVTAGSAIALDSSNRLWVWGKGTYDGAGTEAVSTRAKNIPNPKVATIKMIGITNSMSGSTPAGANANPSPTYYVLHADGSLYALGGNSLRALGNWDINSEATTWIQPRYNSANGTPMNDIKWISPNEHSANIPAISVLNNQAQIYCWGDYGFGMIGQAFNFSSGNPGMPVGINATEKILVVSQGGHTAMAIKLNEPKMGYTGHYVRGSAGNANPGENAASDTNVYGYRFVDMPAIQVCGLATPFVQNISGCGALDLTTAIQSTNVTPSDAVIRWFNGDNPATATQITNITAVAPGTYYAFYYYASTTSYSPPSSPVVATTAGAAGSVAPIINDGTDYIATNSAYYIACGNTTANLSALTASNKPAPASVILTWHSATPATAANRIDPVTAVTGATRKIYAAFWDNVALCYSPTKEVTIYAPICAINDDYGAVILGASAYTSPTSILLNDTFNGNPATLSNVTLTVGALPSGFTFNGNGTFTVANTVSSGNYTFNYTICDLNDNSLCKTASVSITIAKDSDGDGILDIYDIDDDNDGITDAAECGGGAIFNYIGFGLRSPTTTSANLYGFSEPGYTPTLLISNILPSADANHMATDAARNRLIFSNSGAQGSIFAYQFATNSVVNIGSGFLSTLGSSSGGAAMYNGDYYMYDDDGSGTLTTSSEGLYRITFDASGNASTRTRVAQTVSLGTDLGDIAISQSGIVYMINSTGILYKLNLAGITSFPAPNTAWSLVGNTGIGANAQLFFTGSGDLVANNGSQLIKINQNTGANIGNLAVTTGQTNWTELSENPYVGFNCASDTDGDGIPNHLDLDSDNDGCPDAIEGAGNFTTLSTSTMPGGNTGATSGTFNLPIVQNLGTAPVGNTPSTMGIPTVAGTGQGVGTSAIANPVLLAGTASADQTIVSGTAPAALTLTGSTGTIQWQVSTDNITFNNVASAGTTASYSPGTLTATRYYRALVTSAGGCTATSNVVKIAVCAAGSVAPVFNDYINGGVQIYSKISSAYGIQCAGGAQTANLIVLVASPAGPVGTSVTWHSATPATDANRINPVTAVTGATRKVYAAFWDSSNSCYSPTKEITIYGPICATDDNFTATPILYGVATTLPISITANDTYLGATIGAPNPNVSIAWEIGNSAVVINADGTLTFNTTDPTLEPGTYTYLYKICDLDPDAVVDSNCAWAEVTFKIISCTNPPNTDPATDFTKTGISDIAGFEGGAVGWPGNVPNGFIAIESRNKGFVITRVASTSVITNPVLGMLVYDMSNSPAPCVKLYSDLGWNCLAKDCLPAATKN